MQNDCLHFDRPIKLFRIWYAHHHSIDEKSQQGYGLIYTAFPPLSYMQNDQDDWVGFFYSPACSQDLKEFGKNGSGEASHTPPLSDLTAYIFL